MGSQKPCHASVKMGGRIKTFEQMMRRFVRECKDVGIVNEVRRRSYFISKNKKRRKKKHAGKMRALKAMKRNKH